MDKEKNRVALQLMKKGYDILKHSDLENLRKSAYFIREAIERIKGA